MWTRFNNANKLLPLQLVLGTYKYAYIQNTECTKCILVYLVELADSLDCYACGLYMISPEKDGFQYNVDEYDVNAKMYNESCTGFDTYLVEGSKPMSKWIRPCPPNVISCFWAKGSYSDESEYYYSTRDTFS